MVEVAEKSANVLLTSERSQLLQNGSLAVIQRKSPPENGFEADPKDGFPLNCNLPASKGTIHDGESPKAM